MNDAAVAQPMGFVYQPVRGMKRKVEFQPLSDGGYERVESVWQGCRWRETGRETVTTMRRI